MAKKTKKPTKPKKTTPVKKTVAKPRQVAPKPRQRPLPEMEQVRVEALEGIAEAIADTREKKNALLEDEKGYIASAIDLLHKYGMTAYRAYGVELVLVPGGDKLRVRLVEQQGQKGADKSDEVEGDAGPGEETGA